MNCIDCYWSAQNAALRADRVCCNKESDRYNQVVAEEEARVSGCDLGETEQAADYRRLNAWEFARKYYM